MPHRTERPIKHVKFTISDTGRNLMGGGGSKKIFKDISDSFVQEIIGEINEIKRTIDSYDISNALAIVEIEKYALAKSHRPTGIFNHKTCPFVGDIGLTDEGTGEFLIRVNQGGLGFLKERIAQANNSKSLKGELSTIKSIKPYAPKVEVENEKSLLVRLISLKDEELEKDINTKFLSLAHEYDIEHYLVLGNPLIYHIASHQQEGINRFINILKEKALLFSAQKTQSIFIQPMTLEDEEALPADAPMPEEDVDYPIVAVVDTSVKHDCPLIFPWLAGEASAIIEEDRDYGHGTFVVGLITNGKFFNNHPEFPNAQAKVFSIGVLGKNGGTWTEVSDMMERVYEENPNIKVWNLSLGENKPVSMKEISEFAIWLDKFQEKHNCICVISAGNINDPMHRRPWPPSADCPKDEQRITSPGDSIMGISVAAMSHIDMPGTIGIKEPTCYSRSGPIANLVLKPDLIHFGGTIPLGISSVSWNGTSCVITKDKGTSFSAPLVSAVTADLWKKMGEETPRYIIKGMLAHSAKLHHEIDNDYRPYYGWGMPQEADQILYCNENEITIVFEGEIASNREVIQKLPFPIVPSMRLPDGKVKGEFFMTVAYDPPVDPDRAFEYCLVNIEAGLGEVRENGTFNNKIPAEKSGFEYELIDGRYKWSPIKVYHQRFPQGVNVEQWKLQIRMMTRAGFVPPESFKQKFAVIMTIRALDRNAQVYNEMVRLMDKYNWEVSNAIAIEPSIRVQS